MRVAIHQPEHLPWIGFFNKMNQVDTFILLDNVQFRKNYFQNRNKIRTHQGWTWVTVPVNRCITTLIKDVTVASDHRWKKKWWDSICQAYNKASYFKAYAPQLENQINKDYSLLCDFNVVFIQLMCNFFDIRVRLIRASSLKVHGERSELLLDCCKKVNATVYLSGISGKEYLEEDKFRNAGIKVEYQEFRHPIYRQMYGPFLPCMTAMDLLFNHGPESKFILMGKGIEVMDNIFL